MTSKRIAQTNQQQKSEKSQESGILQRAAVRSVSEAGVQSTEDKEAQQLGNSAFSKDFSRVPISTTKPQQIMAKLMIGPVRDKYEQEADRVAAQVVQRINAPASVPPNQQQTLQRQDIPEDEDELQMKPELTIQRQEIPEEELQRKPMLQLRAAQGGMAATPELESSIERLRGSGQPFTDRKPFERGFGGVDFSGVRIHKNAQSDRLNRAIQAKAFTTKKDIFFRRNEYQPRTRKGQELIAHELDHWRKQNSGLVQKSQDNTKKPKGGNPIRQTRRESSVATQTLIQRDIGFEYETNVDTYQAQAPLTQQQVQDINIPGDARPLNKGDILISNMAGLRAEADEGGAGLGSNLELVTDAFPETIEGRNRLHKALKNLERFCKLIDGQPHSHVKSTHLASTFGGQAELLNSYMRHSGNISGNPQATVGVRLNKVAELMERTVGGPSVGPHAVGQHAPIERLELGIQDGPDFRDVGDAPGKVRDGINAYVTANQQLVAPLNNFPSDELVGLCSLLLSYIKRGTVGQMYAKQIAPLMARTDFGSMFRMDLPGEEQTFLSNNGGAEFINMWTQIINQADVRGGINGQLFAQEPMTVADAGLNISGSLTRQAWLAGISQNHDQLTAKNFPFAAPLPNHIRNPFFGLGAMGNQHDNVDPINTNIQAPILELRRMTKNVNPHDFTEKAMGIFDYIVALNSAAPGVHPQYQQVARQQKNPKMAQNIAYNFARRR